MQSCKGGLSLERFSDPEIYLLWGGKPKSREYVTELLGAASDEDGSAVWPFLILHERNIECSLRTPPTRHLMIGQ